MYKKMSIDISLSDLIKKKINSCLQLQELASSKKF
jgi:hypothetical protein